MRLVAATAADAPALAEVHARAFDAPWSAQAIAGLLEGPGVFGLLVDDDGPVGMILCRAVLDEAEILTVAVAPGARRRGVGAALVEAATGAAQALGVTKMFLEVAEDNFAAMALYHRQGFSQAGVRPRYYDRGTVGKIHALLMHRELNAAPTSA